MWQTIHQKVRRAFSDAALNYEVLSNLHKEIGRELVRKVIDKDCHRILDVGTGTGYLANKAKFYFPEAFVVGLDIADGMVLEANKLKEGIQIVQADACAMPFTKEVFDLLISNLSYQWVGDLDLAFQQAYGCIAPRGNISMTVFGKRSLHEMFETIDAVMPEKPPVRRLPDMETYTRALVNAGFEDVESDYEIIKVQFADVIEMLRWVKGIGANVLNDRMFLGKQTIAKLEEHYRRHYPYFEGICVTFEIIWLQANKAGLR